MTNEQLAEIRARAEAATNGAFVAVDRGNSWYIEWAGHIVAREMCEDDAVLFANARADVLALVAEVDRLRNLIDRSNLEEVDGYESTGPQLVKAGRILVSKKLIAQEQRITEALQTAAKYAQEVDRLRHMLGLS